MKRASMKLLLLNVLLVFVSIPVSAVELTEDWTTLFGQPGDYLSIRAVTMSSSGRILAACYWDGYTIAELDPGGALLDTLHLPDYVTAGDILIADNDDVVIIGSRYLDEDDIQIVFKRYTPDFELLWETVWPVPMWETDPFSFSVQEVTEGPRQGCLVATSACSSSDYESNIYRVHILSPSGELTRSHVVSTADEGAIKKILIDHDSLFVLVYYSNSLHNEFYHYIEKQSIDGGTIGWMVQYDTPVRTAIMGLDGYLHLLCVGGDDQWMRRYDTETGDFVDERAVSFRCGDMFRQRGYTGSGNDYVYYGISRHGLYDQPTLQVISADYELLDTQEWRLPMMNWCPSADCGLLIANTTAYPDLGEDSVSMIRASSTGVFGPDTESPSEFALLPCYPNPFNGEARVRLTLAHPGRVDVRLFDVLGREAAMVLRDQLSAGSHVLIVRGDGLSNGVYLLRAVFPDGSQQTQKVMLLK